MSQDSPSGRREHAIGSALRRLGASKTKDERYNNGQAHYSLAVFTSFTRAFEARMASVVQQIEATIIEAVKVDEEAKPEDLIGETISLNRPLFLNTMTLTQWIENFYQESPSINAMARQDQVTICTEAFKTPAFAYWQPQGEVDQTPKHDQKGKK